MTTQSRRCCCFGVLVSKSGNGKGRSLKRGVSVAAFYGMCALVLGAVLSDSASAQELWSPFSRAPRDPIEQGRIDSANDPAEAVNRRIFEANRAFDAAILKPAAKAYLQFYPDVRQGIHNFAVNVGEPVVFVNDVLQGNLGRAWNTTQRFAINTTVGVAGIKDVAATSGKPHHYADLGQTFGVWGIAPGPVVQIPILGPSNLRDAVGLATTSLVGTFAFQGTIVSFIPYIQAGATAVNGVDYRSRMLPNTDALEKSTQDLYSSVRLINAQLRAKLVEEGKAGRASFEEASGDGSAGN
jgi:phospholipid-binding lipoprotein MlaA